MAVESRRARRDRTGREQRRRSAAARARKPNLSRYYGRTLSPVTPGMFEFELTLLRGEGVAPMALAHLVESFEWTEEETAMAGSVQLRRPDREEPGSLPIGRGHRIRCRVRWGGRWYTLWTMRCSSPSVAVDTGAVTVALTDDLDLLTRGRRDRVYRTTKARRHGYFPHDLVRREAAREGVKVGQLAQCTRRMPKAVKRRCSLLEWVSYVYGHESEKTARRYIVRLRDGRLEVIPYGRNRTLFVLGEQLRSATVTTTPKVESPATVWEGRARVGKGADAKKIRHTEYRRAMVRRFGYVHKVKDYGRVRSHGELREKVRRDLAKQYKVDRTADIEFAGIPFIRRGDGCQLVLPSEGFRGQDSFVYTTGVRHQVQGQSYTTSASVTQDDPFEAERERREKALRALAKRHTPKKAAA